MMIDIKEYLSPILASKPDPSLLWEGDYKIPWNDPDFSRRMLAEHLSQDHDLASRKSETIAAQVKWIHETMSGQPSRLLDIGCGPGLYIERLAELGYESLGIDFSPASIQHARSRLGDRARLVEGDVRTADFETGHDLAMLLFGELNVFSPTECRALLKKTYDSLAPGGRILIEVHAFQTVWDAGMGPDSWYKSGSGLTGLFSDEPYVCLMENHWFEEEATAEQVFYILETASDRVRSYRNTIKAWTNEEYEALLKEAGFSEVTHQASWPVNSPDYLLFSGIKGR